MLKKVEYRSAIGVYLRVAACFHFEEEVACCHSEGEVASIVVTWTLEEERQQVHRPHRQIIDIEYLSHQCYWA